MNIASFGPYWVKRQTSTIDLPLFLESFNGTGSIQDRAPTIAPSSFLWNENYGSGAAALDGSGSYVPVVDDYEEIYTSTDSIQMIDNVQVIEFSMRTPTYTGESNFYRMYSGDAIFRNSKQFSEKPPSAAWFFKEIQIKLEGFKPEQEIYHGYAYSALHFDFWVISDEISPWTNIGGTLEDDFSWIFPEALQEETIFRIEIEQTQQRLYMNGNLKITLNINLEHNINVDYVDFFLTNEEPLLGEPHTKLNYVFMDDNVNYQLPNEYK